jgi:hypothetical protein
MNDDEIQLDRHVRILTPSSDILRRNSIKRRASEEFLLNGNADDHRQVARNIVVTSTCLDDDQMVIELQGKGRLYARTLLIIA